MRSLLIADRDLALRESPLLHRLTIGLLDAGVHVTFAAPQSVIDRIEPSLGVEILPYRLGGAIWTRSLRVAELLERFAEATRLSEDEDGIVHAFGASCMAFASVVSRTSGFSLILEASSRAGIPACVASAASSHRSLILASSTPLAQASIAAGAEAGIVRERAWGVSMAAPPGREPGPDQAMSIAIGGAGRDTGAWVRAIQGIALVAARHDQISVFLDADAAQATRIGQAIGSAGLSPLVSRVPDFEARRELTVQCDVLLWPERLGETRSIVIDAANAGSAIIAVEDPDSPLLAPGGVAEIVGGEPASWADAVERLLSSRELRRQRAESQRAYIEAHHGSASHVSGVLDAYEWCTKPGSAADEDPA